MKAAAVALKKFPRFNSSIDMESEEIIIKHYHNIGFAVDTERGLLVPVIRDVDCKSIFDLAVELKVLAEKTRQGRQPRRTCQGGLYDNQHRPDGRDGIISDHQLPGSGDPGNGTGKIAACREWAMKKIIKSSLV